MHNNSKEQLAAFVVGTLFETAIFAAFLLNPEHHFIDLVHQYPSLVAGQLFLLGSCGVIHAKSITRISPYTSTRERVKISAVEAGIAFFGSFIPPFSLGLACARLVATYHNGTEYLHQQNSKRYFVN